MKSREDDDATEATSLSESTSKKIRKKKRSPIRRDIQGLRMLAVLAVIFDHMISWPSGGFVGVDVFFVISGFLITGILLREHEKTERISFLGFYQRRIKRIVPAATVVLTVTVVVAAFLFNAARYTQTLWDAVWAFFFSVNWHFALAGTDYFQADGPVSPLQHFWSLSVEEQFYFVWPWVMLGALALAGFRGRAVRRRLSSGLIMLAIVVASFLLALQQSASTPTVAYFSTFTRAWELGIGALIAIASPWWAKLPAVTRPILGWFGLLGIFASFFVINDSLTFPAPWALMPVLATAVVIIAGTGGKQRFLFPLTNRVSRYLGDISYSLYLWHFPVIVFAGVLIVHPVSWIYYPALLALIVMISAASYALIERPIREMPFWVGKASSRRRKARWDYWRQTNASTYKFGGLATLAIFLVLVVTAVVLNRQANLDEVAAAKAKRDQQHSTSVPVQPSSGSIGPATAQIKAEVFSALKITNWPVTSPSIDTVLGSKFYFVKKEWQACTVPGNSVSLSNCTWTSAPSKKSVLLVGDSTAVTYIEALRVVAEKADWDFSSRATTGCPALNFYTKYCGIDDTRHRDETQRIIANTKPDVLVITTAYSHSDAAGKPITQQVRQAALSSFIRFASPFFGKVVVLAPSPSDKNLGDCYAPTSKASDCVSGITAGWITGSSADKTTAGRLGATFINPRPLFCFEAQCPPVSAGLVVRTGGAHLTPEYSRHVGTALAELLTAAGIK
jgi:peptidoglycan/LPS O-acetylase OafA/YrhL